MLRSPILPRFSFLFSPQTRPTRRRLLSVSLVLLIGSSLLVTPVQLPAHAQDAPTPLSPAGGTTTTTDNYPPLGIPEFTWTPVAGTTAYRIQFSQDIGFSNIPFQVTTPNTSYTPTSANTFSDGIWYWRVRVESPSASAYSTIMSFTKQWASSENAPTLTSPADGTTLAFFDKPVFSWQPVTGAAYYRLDIDSSPDFISPLDYSQTTLAPSHQPANKLANGTYHWRVIPLDPANREGTSSEVREFTVNYNKVPTLLEPADDSEPTFTPTFRWTAMRGAEFYRLQYSTDPTFDTAVNQVDTRNTTYTPYTPLGALPNDVNYYWRVRVHSGKSVAEEWSETWSFIKKWYTQTVLLTPVNLYQYVEYPLLSWTPVPGASRYKVEVSPENTFPPVSGGFSAYTANPFYVGPERNWPGSSIWYWRVTPVDRDNNEGLPSNVSSFKYNPTAGAPQLIHPLYYYSPKDPNLQHLQILQPREDRTVAIPTFMWHRFLTSTLIPNDQAAAYRVQVDDDPLFWSPNWTFDTENLSAVPTADNPFTPTAGTDYYWHVRPLDGLGGVEVGQWSQRWRTRIDTTRGLTPTSDITLLRPAHGYEAMETILLLEWWPLQGADAYDVQISTDADFGGTYTILTATVPYPAHALQERLGYGTYYWRVRGRSGGSPLGGWSEPWRFQVAAQSHWREGRTLKDSGNQLLIGSDPAGDMADPNYDLATLYAAQSKDDWLFGFSATATITNMTYVLYLDLDHEDDSGAPDDAEGHDVATISAHRPEYAIYIRQDSGAFSAGDVGIYPWTGVNWDTPYILSEIGGDLYYSSTANYLEIQVPDTAIGMEEETGSASVLLFSALDSGGHAQDSVPSDPDVDYDTPDSGSETTTLSRFTSVSERVNLAMPPSNATGDPTLFPSVPPLFVHKPVDVPWNGYNLEVALDEEFTSPLLGYTVWPSPFIPPAYTHYEDFDGDNTYYWRVRPVYVAASLIKGAWSQPGRFERLGFVAQHLQTSVTFATPTFSWDMVEGARDYNIEVDDDPGFGSPEVQNAATAQNSHTPIHTLDQGIYYWRVRVNRYDGIINDWTYTQTFTLNLLPPVGLSHDPAGVAGRAPTLCWTPLITPTSDHPVLAAWKYRVEVSKGDPTFSSIYDFIETEQACWTPSKGYEDGTYYWRVAMRDGESKLGSYSEPITFTKQYPITTLISPTTGSTLAETPTFVWTPVDGAGSYRLEVSLFSNFGTLYDWVNTNNTRYTPNKEYATGETYHWRVAIIDKDGKYGPFNTATIILDPYPYSVYLPLVVRH